jgi:hypothetical protein
MAIKKKSSNIQHSAETTPKQKVKLVDEWHNYGTHKKDFMTNTKLERTCERLIDWARDTPDAINIKEFVAKEGISEKTWNTWRDRYDYVQEAIRQAKMHIGLRREKWLIGLKHNSGALMHMQPFYDNDYREMLELRENLKQKRHDEDGGTKFIIMEKYPESDQVPKKKENNE